MSTLLLAIEAAGTTDTAAVAKAMWDVTTGDGKKTVYNVTDGLAAIRVTVGELATLIPEADPKARWPHTEYDIAAATGPLRSVAAVIIDQGGERTGAALQTARLINALPRAGRASEAQRDQVWRNVEVSPESSGYALVETGFDQCYRVTRSGMMSLRQCLGSLHDRWISKLNVDYWEAVDAGS